jgi:hypothetical protein
MIHLFTYRQETLPHRAGQFDHYKGKMNYFEYLRAGQAGDRKTQPLIIPPSPPSPLSPLSPLLSNSLSFLDNILRDKQQGRKHKRQ